MRNLGYLLVVCLFAALVSVLGAAADSGGKNQPSHSLSPPPGEGHSPSITL